MNAGSARLDMFKHGKRTDSSARVLNDMEVSQVGDKIPYDNFSLLELQAVSMAH